MRTIYPPTNISPNHWLRKFYNYLPNQDLSPATVRGYFYDMNHFRTWLMELNEVRNQFLQYHAVGNFDLYFPEYIQLYGDTTSS